MRCFLFVVLFAAGASSDEMGALRDAVGKLTGSAPISATIDVTRSRHSLRLLARTSVASTTNSSRNGRPATLVVLTLPPASDGGDFGAVSVSEDHLKVRYGADHVPMAAERVRRGSAGLLFLHIEAVRTQSWTLAVESDHLVATRFDDSAIVSGPGQKGDARTVWTVREVKAR